MVIVSLTVTSMFCIFAPEHVFINSPLTFIYSAFVESSLTSSWSRLTASRSHVDGRVRCDPVIYIDRDQIVDMIYVLGMLQMCKVYINLTICIFQLKVVSTLLVVKDIVYYISKSFNSFFWSFYRNIKFYPVYPHIHVV